jgi:peroxiredoxin
MAIPGSPNRLSAGTVISGRELVTISDTPIHVPDAKRLVHLQFRRFAGCPICNLHLRQVVRRLDEIEAAGVLEVVVFHSTKHQLLAHAADLPLAVVADPDKRLYAEFGVESGVRAIADPRAWPSIAKGILVSLKGVAVNGKRLPSLKPQGGRYGLPADFLIAPDGRVAACKYGTHASDQWSVDEILALAHKYSPPAIDKAPLTDVEQREILQA